MSYSDPQTRTGAAVASKQIRSIAIIASDAYSLVNFRGPLMEELIARGVRVYALAPDYDDGMRGSVEQIGAKPVDISLDRAGLRPLRDVADAIRLVFLLRRLRPDATLAYFIKPVIYGTLAAKAAGVGSRFALIAGLGYLFSEDPDGGARPPLRALARTLYRAAFALCDRIFFQNSEDLAEFVDGGLLPASKALRLNGTGVDLERLRPAAPVVASPTFLLMARLLKQKGICEFASAAALVKARFPSVRFILLGGLDPNPNGISREQVESWVKDGRLEWPGHVTDVTPWIAQSSVYVLPSYYREGVPRSSQEAMAMGRPIITTDNIGCRETIVDGVNGLVVPARDADALSRAMTRFVEHPELIGPMGRESRRLAEERFDIRKVNAAILAAIGVPLDVACDQPRARTWPLPASDAA